MFFLKSEKNEKYVFSNTDCYIYSASYGTLIVVCDLNSASTVIATSICNALHSASLSLTYCRVCKQAYLLYLLALYMSVVWCMCC